MVYTIAAKLRAPGSWILNSGSWLLDSEFWLLDSGFWILNSEFEFEFWLLDSKNIMLMHSRKNVTISYLKTVAGRKLEDRRLHKETPLSGHGRHDDETCYRQADANSG
jgi:hypothetical protein